MKAKQKEREMKKCLGFFRKDQRRQARTEAEEKVKWKRREIKKGSDYNNQDCY